MQSRIICISFLLAILLMATSCSRKFLVQQAVPTSDEVIQNVDRIDIRTYYGGDMRDFITFQVDVDNRSDSPVSIKEMDFDLLLIQDRDEVLYPIRKSILLDDLYSKKDQVKREKKAATFANVVATGFGIVAGVMTGVDGVSQVFYGADSVTGMIDQRRAYNAYQGDIEEIISYHEEYTLDDILIEAGRSASFDIHFDRMMVEASGMLRLRCNDTVVEFPYDLYLQEVKE